MSYGIDDIPESSPSPKVDAWKPAIGEFHSGEIQWVARKPWVKDDDMRNRTIASLKIVFGDLAIYPRTHIGPVGDSISKLDELDPAPDNLMRAIVRAVKEAGGKAITEGDTLTIKRIEDVPVEIKGKTFYAHDFVAKYAKAAGVKVDPFDVVGTDEADATEKVTVPPQREEDPFA